MSRFTGRTRRGVAAASAGTLLTLMSMAACSDGDGPDDAVKAFLDGWRTGKLDAVALIRPDSGKIASTDVAAQLKDLSGELAGTPPELKLEGESTETGGVTSQPVAVSWKLPAGGTWAYTTTVRLREGRDAWQVIWEPAVVNPKLTAGDKLGVRRVAGQRAPVLDAQGQPLFAPRPVVSIGVEPQAVKDLDKLVGGLATELKKVDVTLNVDEYKNEIKAAKPNAFVSAVTLRRPKYDQIKARVQPLEGTRFNEFTRILSPDTPFARALLGTVDDATADDVKARPAAIKAGDVVGHGGLQGKYDEQLRGKPAERIVILKKAPDGKTTEDELYAGKPQPGVPLKTTLDPKVQNAADAAAGPETRRSALVALRIKDGAVLAVANGPGGGSDNLAFTAKVPPGSTFKMVTAVGALDKGVLTPDTSLDCPKTITVDGREFKNAHDMPEKASFRQDFAISCNTAFASLAPQLGADGLAATARTLGLGVPWQLGIDAFSGSVATGEGAAAQAAAAFGQGTTTVSPLAMAGATAAVAGGRFRQPKIILEPAPQGAAADGPALKPDVVEGMKTLMRGVVADANGTATSLKDVPGGPVYGKTGTAEFENDNADTHAWFVGFQGDIAFAAFVEGGGSGADAAVPMVQRFLTNLAR